MDTAFSLRGTNYRLQISISQVTSFSVSLFDDDLWERWVGEFTAPFIEDVARKVGYPRTAAVFWEMLRSAVSGASPEVSFDIQSAEQIRQMRSDSGSSSRIGSNPDNMYFIVSYVTAFDLARFPLQLPKRPYTPDEWRQIVRGVKSENRKLQEQLGSSTQEDMAHRLESQIFELNAAMKRLAEEKDRTIGELKRKIVDLEKAHARQTKRYIEVKETKQPIVRAPIGKRPPGRSASGSSAGSSRNASARKQPRTVSRGSAGSARSSSRGSAGSFKRFDPTEWVKGKKSGASSRGASPTVRPKKPAVPKREKARIDQNLNRIRALVNQRYRC
jgi:hypothetical protein